MATWSLWTGTEEVPLVLEGVWDGTAVNPVVLDGEDPVESDLPVLVDVETLYYVAQNIPVPVPQGDTVIACLAWNEPEPITAPTGWTLVEEVSSSNARAAVYLTTGGVTGNVFTLPTALKLSAVCLGYTSAEVIASEGYVGSGPSNIRTAPAVFVPEAPAKLLRFWWDRSTVTTQIVPPAEHTVVGEVYGGTTASCAVLAAEQDVSQAGTAPAADAEFNASSGNGGGFSIVMKTG